MTKTDLENEIKEELALSKQVAEKYEKQFCLLLGRAKTIFADLDTTNPDDVDFGNSLIDKLNDLIEIIKENQNLNIRKLKKLNLTDETGKALKVYYSYVVGEVYVNSGITTYFNRRIVYARCPKEALLKYHKVIDNGSSSASCLGIFDEKEPYSQNIENQELIK